MKTEIVCAIIALVGTAVSGLLSWFVSRSSAVKEVEKLRLTWEHETIVTSDDPALIMQFAELRPFGRKNRGHLPIVWTTFIAFFLI